MHDYGTEHDITVWVVWKMGLKKNRKNKLEHLLLPSPFTDVMENSSGCLTVENIYLVWKQEWGMFSSGFVKYSS